MDNKSNLGCAPGVGDVVLIVFIILKLCHVINWPWPVVLIPLWIGLALAALVLLVLFIAAVFSES